MTIRFGRRQTLGVLFGLLGVFLVGAAGHAGVTRAIEILREDVVLPSLPADEALANVPERDDDLVVVPAILGGA